MNINLHRNSDHVNVRLVEVTLTGSCESVGSTDWVGFQLQTNCRSRVCMVLAKV